MAGGAINHEHTPFIGHRRMPPLTDCLVPSVRTRACDAGAMDPHRGALMRSCKPSGARCPTNTERTAAMNTLNAIRDHGPCTNGWRRSCCAHLAKTAVYDLFLKPSPYSDSNGVDDALWCLRPYPATTGKSASSPSGARARCSTRMTDVRRTQRSTLQKAPRQWRSHRPERPPPLAAARPPPHAARRRRTPPGQPLRRRQGRCLGRRQGCRLGRRQGQSRLGRRQGRRQGAAWDAARDAAWDAARDALSFRVETRLRLHRCGPGPVPNPQRAEQEPA